MEQQAKADVFKVMTQIVENLPGIADPTDMGNLRKEYLVQRLAGFVTSSITVGVASKGLDIDTIETTVWLLRGFRTMIETAWGLTIETRDEFGGADQDKKAQPTQV